MTKRSTSSLPRPLARHACDLATRLREALRGGARVHQQVFAARLEPGEAPMVVAVLATEGKGHGLMVFTGDRALRTCREVVLDRFRGDREHARTIFAEQVVAVRSIPEGMRDWMVASGRSSAVAPMFFTEPASPRIRSLRKAEMKWFVEVMELVLAATNLDMLETVDLSFHGPTWLPCLSPVDDPSIPIECERERIHPEGRVAWEAQVETVADLPVSDGRWLLGAFDSESSIAGVDAWRTAVVQLEGRASGLQVEVLDVDPDQQIVDVLHTLMLMQHNGAPIGRPTELLCSDRRLYEAVRDRLAESGVRSEFRDDLPELAATIARIETGLEPIR